MSLDCLNTNIVWDNAYFRKLRGALTQQTKDMLYSFTNTDPEATNQYKYVFLSLLFPFSLNTPNQFRVAFRGPHNSEVVLLNVRCTIVTTIRVIESLLEECIRINKDKIVLITPLVITLNHNRLTLKSKKGRSKTWRRRKRCW